MAAHQHAAHHHHGVSVISATPQQMVQDTLRRMTAGSSFWTAAIIFGVIFLVGLVSLFLRATGSGLVNGPDWGYASAVLGFMLISSQAAPLVALGFRFNKADWRRPISRIAELWAMAGLVTLVLFAVVVQTIPPTQGRLTIWFDFQFGGPRFFDTIAILFTVVLGIAALYFSALPDFATIRDLSTGARRERYARWALGWTGTPRQWKVLHFGLILIGALYALMMTYVHLLYTSDFGMTLVPGWRSAILPAFSMLTAFQCAIATVLISAFLWRKLAGLEEYIRLDQFWALAKLLLATSLLWFYFFWSDFIVHWYGRMPREITILELLMVGPYLWAFVLAFGFSFFVPWWTLIWNKVRVSITGPTIVAVIVLIGNFFNQIRWYVAARTTADQLFPAGGGFAHLLEFIPPTRWPDLLDIGIVVGMLSGAVLLYLLASRIFPPLSLWEMKQGMMLRTTRRYIKGEYVVVGKPT